MGKFVQGHQKVGGKKKGTPNTITKTVKETVLAVFQELQLTEKTNLKAFAEKYPREFYQIAAKLIPTDIKADLTFEGETKHTTVTLPDGTTINL